MTSRKPLVLIDGEPSEIPVGDSVPLADALVGGIPLIRRYITETNDEGRWFVEFDDFEEVVSVIPVALSGTQADQTRIANLVGFNNGAATGTVVEPSLIRGLIGGDPLGVTEGSIVIVTVLGK